MDIMKQNILAFFIALLSLIVFDAIWLSLTMTKLYRKYLSHLLAPEPVWWAAILFYIVYAFGIYFLVVRAALANNLSLGQTFLAGLILGMVAYGTYDLTNHATLLRWPAFITFIDVIWGSLMTGSIAVLSLLLTRKIFS
jgi:uncharacterized membrane protein